MGKGSDDWYEKAYPGKQAKLESMYLPNTPHEQDLIPDQIFKENLTFPFSLTDCYTK